MERKLLKTPNYLYAIILILVISAWFSVSSVQVKSKNDISPMTTKKAVPVNLQALGIKFEDLIPCIDCNIEHINDVQISNDVFQVEKGKQLKISGWVLDRQNARIPEYVIAQFEGINGHKYSFIAPVGFSRPDVVAYFNLSPKLFGSGYIIDLSNADILPDIYSVKLILPFDDHNYVCDNGRKVEIN